MLCMHCVISHIVSSRHLVTFLSRRDPGLKASYRRLKQDEDVFWLLSVHIIFYTSHVETMALIPAHMFFLICRVCKILGSGVTETRVINGIVVKRAAEGNVTSAEKAKVAVFACPLDIGRTETKGMQGDKSSSPC